MAELEFHGAAGTVTGSMHMVHLPQSMISLDCGLFQGRRSVSRVKNRVYPIKPKRLHAVLLSHAHIDHSGRIPGLVRHGFEGTVFATAATSDLCEVMLKDSAHIQQEDAMYWNQKRAKTPDDRIEPVYTEEDAAEAIRHFHSVRYNVPVPVSLDCTATFLDAGHILGSACILLEVRHNGRQTRIFYTGDIGRFDIPILRDPPNPLPPVDYLITESTYAGREHENPTEMKQRLVDTIESTRARNGKVIIPAFSVGRTQRLAYLLQQAIAEGLLTPLPIFVDSPLSYEATKVFRNHPECYDQEARDFWFQQGDVFGRDVIRYITELEDSKALNNMADPCVIISASGMCEAGRILHHLKNNIEDKRNTVVIVGYMPQYTMGRRLVERCRDIKIFGKKYRLKCRVKKLSGFSGHADGNEFRKMFGPIARGLKAAFAVHGEADHLKSMRALLEDIGCPTVHTPEPGERFELE